MKYLTDENFRGDILRGVQARLPDADIIRVQDTDFGGAPDDVLLEWAANQAAVLMTHDVRTVTKFANDRIREGLLMPGVIEVAQHIGLGRAIEDLVFLIEIGEPADFENRIWYVPLK